MEGNSIRATVRMTGVAKATVTKLLVDMGTVCSVEMDRRMRDLSCERLQCDEIWAFVYAKQKNIPDSKKGEDGIGDVWTWVAIDADTKLVPSFVIGPRDLNTATEFMTDLAKRLRNRVQLTTDGNHPYLQSVRGAFGGEIDYAQLIKFYGTDSGKTRSAATRRESASARNAGRSSAARTRSTSPRPTSSGRTSRCE